MPLISGVICYVGLGNQNDHPGLFQSHDFTIPSPTLVLFFPLTFFLFTQVLINHSVINVSLSFRNQLMFQQRAV